MGLESQAVSAAVTKLIVTIYSHTCTLVKVQIFENPITVGNFAFLFNCTPVGRTSDSMTVPT